MSKHMRLYVTVAALAAALGGALVAWLPAEQPVRQVTTGKALIRSEFQLVNHRGMDVTQDTYSGKWQLVFFGFTFCPDVCPTTLAAMGTVLEQLGDDAEKVTPLFITVDPERDTPEVLAEYVANFHPRIVGLTGTKAQVQAAIKSFRVYASRVEQADAPDGYLMNHTGFIYLMHPNGDYKTHYTERDDPVEKMVASIRGYVK